MLTFFHSWRRKIGVMTLVLALLFMGGWARSLSIADIVMFPARKCANNSNVSFTIDSFASAGKSVIWLRGYFKFDKEVADFAEKDATSPFGSSYPTWNVSAALPDFDVTELKWRWRYCGFGICEVGANQTDDEWSRALFIPYCLIVIPLTLLSAYLLLSKPRVAKPRDATKPTDAAKVIHA